MEPVTWATKKKKSAVFETIVNPIGLHSNVNTIKPLLQPHSM